MSHVSSNQLSQAHNKLFLFQIVNYKQANTITGWLDGCMVELETESDDEDIIDVVKHTIDKGEFENNDNQNEGSKSQSLSV